jgi:hypothetical protein
MVSYLAARVCAISHRLAGKIAVAPEASISARFNVVVSPFGFVMA